MKICPECKTRFVRLKGKLYEFGHIALNFADRSKDKHIVEGTAPTYEEACTKNQMVPRTTEKISETLRAR